VRNTNASSIKPARPEDIPRLCDLLAELFSIESDFEPDREKQAKGLGMLMAAPQGTSLVLVAVMEEKIVGMATVQTLVSTAEGGRVGLVEDVIVGREFRGRGAGMRLLDGIAAWCREQGLKRVQLLADVENMPALDFYKNRRWNRTGLICLRKML
jgi:GNAT superfamily N-acetyltransferase